MIRVKAAHPVSRTEQDRAWRELLGAEALEEPTGTERSSQGALEKQANRLLGRLLRAVSGSARVSSTLANLENERALYRQLAGCHLKTETLTRIARGDSQSSDWLEAVNKFWMPLGYRFCVRCRHRFSIGDGRAGKSQCCDKCAEARKKTKRRCSDRGLGKKELLLRKLEEAQTKQRKHWRSCSLRDSDRCARCAYWGDEVGRLRYEATEAHAGHDAMRGRCATIGRGEIVPEHDGKTAHIGQRGTD